MSVFTCLSCHVAFANADGQKDHFRSEWHRYNLMRKVAELPPVSRETFNERAQQVETQIAQMTQTKEEKKKYCKPCGRSFANKMTYDNHLNSKKHVEKSAVYFEEAKNRRNLAKQKSMEDDADSDDDDDEDALSKTKMNCKSCNESFADQVAFYNHMKSKKHMERSAACNVAVTSKKSGFSAGQSTSKMDVDSDDDSEYEELEGVFKK
ncbi:hypothetical protein SK128_011950 [Halocaridina rubra]|uniref:C2H2-type domain-containing protein n=1 Tax=Halocaridina rubra TaxID=373956 RepID=A0AAN8XKB5_HALRR